jgi:hypothetical protein
MNKQSNHTALPSERQKDDLRKLPYEKPRLGAVQLFADQVLAGCRLDSPCASIHPIATGS